MFSKPKHRLTKEEADKWYLKAVADIKDSLLPEEEIPFALQKKLITYRRLLDEATEP
jgi:hypothetical protein